MKILCVVVLFKPNIESLGDKLTLLQNNVDKVMLWDNTPGGIGRKKISGIDVLGNGENIGLSKAYNTAWNFARTLDFDHLMLMDQDTKWCGLPIYVSQIRHHNNMCHEKCIYFASTKDGNKVPFTKVTHGCVNSGTIIPICLLDRINGFHEDFFVDAIDDWLMLKATKEGYTCYMVGNSHIVQKYGNPSLVKFLGYTFTTRNYSPMRLYGIMRNYIILWKEFRIPNDMKKKIIVDFCLIPFIKIIIGEPLKILKLKAMCYGIIDGVSNNPSRINLFMRN